jgi:tetratricopeptide (TPR) repeat protein
MILGQYERAEPDLRAAVEVERSIVMIGNLTTTFLALGRLDEAEALVERSIAMKYDSHIHHHCAYLLAFLRGHTAAMTRHYEAVMGRESEEEVLVQLAAQTEAFHGRFDRARELAARAADLALRGGSAEVAATWMAEAALREAHAGFADRARDQADAALATGTGRNVVSLVALVYALCGREADAERLAAQLEHDYPQYTLVQRYWLSSIRGALALARGDWKGAVAALEAAVPLELGVEEPFSNPLLIPPYLRALAYQAGGQTSEATREFEKITSRPYLARNNLVLALAREALSR